MYRYILLIFLAALPACSRPSRGLLTISSIDVGQGDANLISFPNGQNWLVDAGGVPAGDTESGTDPGHRNVLPVLRAKAIQSLDTVVMTHPDEDHVQGMLAIARHIPVRQVYWNGFVGSKTEQRVRRTFLHRGARVDTVRAGDSRLVGDVEVRVLSPSRKPIMRTRSPENDNSIVLRLKYINKTVLLTGDVETLGEKQLLRNHPMEIRMISLLKVAHHGSDSSTIPAMVRITRPEVAFISCGKRNRYGHPSPDVVDRLSKTGCDVYRTDFCGMLEWSSDGYRVSVATMLPCNTRAVRLPR